MFSLFVLRINKGISRFGVVPSFVAWSTEKSADTSAARLSTIGTDSDNESNVAALIFCLTASTFSTRLRSSAVYERCWNFPNFLNCQTKILNFERMLLRWSGFSWSSLDSKNSDWTPIWIVRLVRSLANRTFQPRSPHRSPPEVLDSKTFHTSFRASRRDRVPREPREKKKRKHFLHHR